MIKNSIWILLFIVLGSCSTPDNSLPGIEVLTSELIDDTTQFEQCHASTLVETNDGLLLAWFAGPYERHPDVSIYTSRLRKGSWSKPEKVADGIVNDTLRYPTWNPVLFRRADNSISLYYKVGPSPNDWWGMVMHSSDEGQTWSKPEKLPDGILGPIRNQPILLESGVILSPSSTEATHELWKSHIERSEDGGQSWTKIDIPSPDSVKVIQPALLIYPGNKIQALMRSNQNVVMESWSEDEGLSWSAVQQTGIRHPNSGIDATTLQSGEKLLVNNPLKSGNSWETGRNKLDLYYSADGKNWTDIFQLEDEPEGEFSYPDIIQTKDGLVHISYTYKRRKIKHVVLKIMR
ncbi:sialidase family protein [Maribellus sediminis]|uniref:sialidase family protein n=1 Tax=Maribellus sediminis TaxID=2696285 RepID=UPI00143113CA|nr:sialidase family protein [Maribellus sediminis]